MSSRAPVTAILIGLLVSACHHDDGSWTRSRSAYCDEAELQQHAAATELSAAGAALKNASVAGDDPVALATAATSFARVGARLAGFSYVVHVLARGRTTDRVGDAGFVLNGFAVAQIAAFEVAEPGREAEQLAALPAMEAKVEGAFKEALDACHRVGWRSSLAGSPYR